MGAGLSAGFVMEAIDPFLGAPEEGAAEEEGGEGEGIFPVQKAPVLYGQSTRLRRKGTGGAVLCFGKVG